ncbi:Bgt-55003 [Blumeria graminis f. sp. tritici]|uniref:Bgt-55003 n=1 Tax=Blumeria graminis f. sp. tritici TaxID=62690 RepID=A0A9X9ML44_BLUGR|nr:Bgt-55003 [Blumeria graminis f. sp. tritici]
MQMSIFFLALMIVGVIAMPHRKHGVISSDYRIISDTTFKTVENMNSTSRKKENKVFLNGKNAVIVTNLATTNRILPITKSAESLTELPVIPTAAASMVENPVKYAKRALHQTPSGFRLDGRRSFPYYNQKSILHLNRLVNGHKILSTNRRLRRPQGHHKTRPLSREKSSFR